MLVTGSARRAAALLSLPVVTLGLAGEGLLRRVAGQDRERVRRELRARNAARTRRVLGDLKGGAQKAGQLLSTVDPAWAELQDAGTPVPLAALEPVLLAELGSGWRALFTSFGEVAVATASLGQVHRATWAADGSDVAVKVQLPGVREALAADLRLVSLVTRVAGVVAPGLALPPLVGELRERLTEELDYEREGRVQAAFASAYAGSASVVVPDVVLARPRVLVTRWLPGERLSVVATDGSPEVRAGAAAAYQEFLVSGPARTGWLHTDPHPGNFRVLPGGRLGVLDFGSALALPGGMPATFGRLIRVLLAGSDAEVERGLREEGFVRAGAALRIAELRAVMAPFVEPARHERFRFSRGWLRSAVTGGVGDPRDPDFSLALALTMPAEQLFTHRVWLGLVGVLCQLESEVPVGPVLRRWLPGFAGPVQEPVEGVAPEGVSERPGRVGP